jgi:hypothetical protein
LHRILCPFDKRPSAILEGRIDEFVASARVDQAAIFQLAVHKIMFLDYEAGSGYGLVLMDGNWHLINTFPFKFSGKAKFISDSLVGSAEEML